MWLWFWHAQSTKLTIQSHELKSYTLGSTPKLWFIQEPLPINGLWHLSQEFWGACMALKVLSGNLALPFKICQPSAGLPGSLFLSLHSYRDPPMYIYIYIYIPSLKRLDHPKHTSNVSNHLRRRVCGSIWMMNSHLSTACLWQNALPEIVEVHGMAPVSDD